MPTLPTSQTKNAQLELTRVFDQLPQRVFRRIELRDHFHRLREQRSLPDLPTASRFVAFLLENTPMREVSLKSEHFRDAIRYVWGEPRPYELALSLGKRPYLSHGSAVFLHGLTEQIPKVIYVNDEQTQKNFPGAALTQQGIDKAFSGRQRTSRSFFSSDGTRVLLLNGKYSDRLEVGEVTAPDGSSVDVTKLERTLIDIAVRPDYAGGPYQVLDAFVSARDRISTNVLGATLTKLAYIYPYHQVIGFYMERAGHHGSKLEPLKRAGLNFDFYLTYGMKEKEYDPEWRLFFPKGF